MSARPIPLYQGFVHVEYCSLEGIQQVQTIRQRTNMEAANQIEQTDANPNTQESQSAKDQILIQTKSNFISATHSLMFQPNIFNQSKQE